MKNLQHLREFTAGARSMFKQKFRRKCLSALKTRYDTPDLMVDRVCDGAYYSIWRTDRLLLEVFYEAGAVSIFEYAAVPGK